MNFKLKYLLLVFTYSFIICNCYAEVRYVSKTGTSTPPYTTWETACDSIQKAINICNDGDTVVVANGIYKETLVIENEIRLLGSSMDSCIIDGTGLEITTVENYRGLILKGFKIIGRGIENNPWQTTCISNSSKTSNRYNIRIENCRILNAYNGVYLEASSEALKNLIITDVRRGVLTFCMSDTCKPKLHNSVIIIDSQSTDMAWLSFDGGQPTIENNIWVTAGTYFTRKAAAAGITYAFQGHKLLILKNNLISGFYLNLLDLQTDSSEILNNIISEKGVTLSENWVLSGARLSDKIRNNIFMKNQRAVWALEQPDMNYNIFWDNLYDIKSPYSLGENDIIADPMIVKDTAGYTLNADYHLQKYSPGIDNGDAEIKDVDGSRSDIGIYGGPLGESYQYLDIPPRTPVNFIISYDSSRDNIIISWKMNGEQDFMKYNIYRSSNPDFTTGNGDKYAESTVAFFVDSATSGYENLYYRITAVDNQMNESVSGQLISVIITDIKDREFSIITDYALYQNYPNPFNSVTKINYGLKEKGYVKLMIYTLTGELIMTIVNSDKEAGFYETEIDLNRFSSGIYLYRIEVMGKGGLPRYMDMKKMVHLK